MKVDGRHKEGGEFKFERICSSLDDVANTLMEFRSFSILMFPARLRLG